MKYTLASFILLMLTSSELLHAEYHHNPHPKSQYFIEEPANQTVTEGDTILLRCQVGNRQGVVQWTRNGFAMGYTNKEIKQICQRCQLNIIESDGIYNLLVEDVRLGDDEYFECQVSPGKGAINSVPLRAPVHITIQVPPKIVTLRKPEPVRAGELLQLACTAKDSNPKTTLVWFRQDNPIPDGAVSEMSEKVYRGSRNGTFMTVSKITLMTSANDDGVTIKCQAQHSALVPGLIYSHLEDFTNLTIYYPPSPPQIHGDLLSEQRSGDQVKLTCVTEGGNPLPTLLWLRNGLPLNERSMLDQIDASEAAEAGSANAAGATIGGIKEASAPAAVVNNPVTEKIVSLSQSRSVLNLIVSPADHGAIYRCRSFAAPTMTRPVDSDESIVFNVTFPPDHVVIEGPKEVQADQSYTYRCEAKNANPAPTIQWIINGVVTTAGVSTQTHPPPPKPSGYVSIHHPTGWRVTSDFALNVMDEDTEIAVTCNAISHGHHGDTMLRKAEKLLTVLRPPSPPEITGLPQNQTLREGQGLSLSCASLDGSPRPHLAWYVGESTQELSHSNFTLNPFSQSQLRLKASREDNNREYRCEAINKANERVPAVARIHYRVFFPPKSLSILVERPDKGSGYDRTIDFEAGLASNIRGRKYEDIRIVVAEELVRIRCEAGESFPRPVFRWLEDEKPREANRTEVAAGTYAGGEIVTSIVEFQARPEHNGKIYQCFAHNPTFYDEMQPELNVTIKLEVLFKPHFKKTEKVFTVIEGETLNISLKTSGNPPQIKYKWKLPSTSSTHRVRTEGPKLILKNAQRMDRGNYSILAWNGHGNFNTTLHVFVDVRFPPRILNLDPNVTKDEDSVAEFRCEVEANPFDAKTVEWKLPHRSSYAPGRNWRDRSQIIVEDGRGVSILRLSGLERSDMGEVICSASNGVKNHVAKKMTYLIINHPPNIDRQPRFTRVAIQRGAPAYLTCRASGVPEVEFIWYIQRRPEEKMKKVGLEHRNRGETVEPSEHIKDQDRRFEQFYESNLYLDNVRSEHYTSVFRCEASNKYGTDYHDIEVVQPGPPEEPKNLNVNHVFDTSINLEWTPGFDGGYNQTFDIQVFEENTGLRIMKLKNIKRINGNQTDIQGLKPQTLYAMKVRAWNREGYSNFSEEIIQKTKSMERAISPDSHMEPQIFIIAMGSGLILVIFVGMVIYLGCFNSRRTHRISQENNHHQNGGSDGICKGGNINKGANTNILHKNRNNRSNSIESNHIERYPPKYPADLFYPPAAIATMDQSGTNSSSSHYRDMAVRTMSLPRRNHYDDEDSGFIRSNGSKNLQESFSLHGTLKRNGGGSNSHFNTTLEDEVFEDSISAPNSAKPLLHDKPPFPHLYTSFDGRDSSSSSRSRCAYPPPLPPIRNTGMHHSGTRTPSRFRIPNSYNQAMRKRTRSTSSGCFLDTIEPDTPTPPPPPIVTASGASSGLHHPGHYQTSFSGTLPRPRSTSSGFWHQNKQPKYKFKRVENPVMDFTSAGSPPLTPVPTPPPPPPHLVTSTTSKSLKSLNFANENSISRNFGGPPPPGITGTGYMPTKQNHMML